MLAAARRRVGFDDFGDGWQPAFQRLLRELDTLNLAPEYQDRTATWLGKFLDARLYCERGWSRFPLALGEAIRKPVIIAGLVRSGTTALHKLMSLDAQFQGPEHWLTLAPMPRPPRASWPEIAEYRVVAGQFDVQVEQMPELRTEHMGAAEEVEETLFILAQNFCCNFFGSMWDIPGYDAWQRTQDEGPNYRRAADCLRLIGLNDRRTWLLKNPGDLGLLDHVLDVFPDARIIQTNRDPVQAIPSVANLIFGSRRMTMGPDASGAVVGHREAGVWAHAVRHAAAVRAKQPPEQFVDVDFSAFAADQLGTVHHIYEAFGLKLSGATEARMGAWLAAHPRGTKTMQRFQPETFGLTADGIKADFAEYRARYGYV